MTKAEVKVLRTIINKGEYVVPEDNTKYDKAVHSLLDTKIVKWGTSNDEALVLNKN